jgi:hypothetical protein
MRTSQCADEAGQRSVRPLAIPSMLPFELLAKSFACHAPGSIPRSLRRVGLSGDPASGSKLKSEARRLALDGSCAGPRPL